MTHAIDSIASTAVIDRTSHRRCCLMFVSILDKTVAGNPDKVLQKVDSILINRSEFCGHPTSRTRTADSSG